MNVVTIPKAKVHDAPSELGNWHSLPPSALPRALGKTFDIYEVGAGDRVIMPAYSRRGIAHAMAAAGLVVELADVDETLTMDVADLERRIQPQTRVVVVHHAAGAPADMNRLIRTVRRQGAVVIEDVSEAPGATLDGRDVGSFGDLAIRERGTDVEVASRLPEVSEQLALLSEWPGTASYPAAERAEAATRRARRYRVLARVEADLPGTASWRLSWDPDGDSGGHLIAFFNDRSASQLAAERLAAERVTASLVFSPEHGRENVAYFWGSGEQSPWSLARTPMDPGDFVHSWALLCRAVRIEIAADLCCHAPDALARRISAALRSLP